MGQTRPLFVLFTSQRQIWHQLTLNDKSDDDMLGTRTQGGRGEVAMAAPYAKESLSKT